MDMIPQGHKGDGKLVRYRFRLRLIRLIEVEDLYLGTVNPDRFLDFGWGDHFNDGV